VLVQQDKRVNPLHPNGLEIPAVAGFKACFFQLAGDS
jgi:hypothetical protein